jgi:hypothetical protein
MMNKKGLELPINMIVLLIISIIIFIGGIALVWKMFGGAGEIQSGIDLQTKSQIEAMLRDSNEIVAIPINKKTADLGKDSTFGLGIRNINTDERGFSVVIGFSGIYDRAGKQIDIGSKDYIESKWLGSFKTQEQIYIKPKKYETIQLRVRAGTQVDDGVSTPRGATAVFNVCVFDAEPSECVLQAPVYDKIYQIMLEVR